MPETGDSSTYRDHTGDAGAVLVVNAGLVTSGRANNACALLGITSMASSSGHTTGPPATGPPAFR